MALEINGEFVDDAIIRAEAKHLRPRVAVALAELDPLTAEMQLRQLAREQVIEQVLLRQEADKDPTPIPPDLLAQATPAGGSNCVTPMNESSIAEDAAAQLRLNRMLARLFDTVPPPKPKEIAEYYRKHPDQFESPELLHAVHIVKNVDENTTEPAALDAIQEVRRQLEAGADFTELADTHSDCPGNGGDLGWFPRGQMVDEFDRVVFAMQPGDVSQVFRTPFGFHIVKLLARKPAGRRSFDEVREPLTGQLHRMKQKHVLEAFIQQLKERAQIREVKAAKR